MNTSESVGRMNEAIAEVERATVPMVHQMIGVAQKNVDQMSATGKEALQIVDANVGRIAGAAVRLASASAELAATIFGRNVDQTPRPQETPSRSGD